MRFLRQHFRLLASDAGIVLKYGSPLANVYGNFIGFASAEEAPQQAIGEHPEWQDVHTQRQ